jgi:hypothetical protein
MLCRFAQFFIKPLMSQDAVLREIKAVDSGEQLLCSVTLMSARHDDFMLILPQFLFNRRGWTGVCTLLVQ